MDTCSDPISLDYLIHSLIPSSILSEGDNMERQPIFNGNVSELPKPKRGKLKIYTAQYRYSNSDRTDITIKSGWKTFAPTWDMVMGLKNGTLTEQEYTEQYRQLMIKSRTEHYHDWWSLLLRDEVTLVCFCRKGAFCHRVLLAKLLEEWYPNLCEYMGER